MEKITYRDQNNNLVEVTKKMLINSERYFLETTTKVNYANNAYMTTIQKQAFPFCCPLCKGVFKYNSEYGNETIHNIDHFLYKTHHKYKCELDKCNTCKYHMFCKYKGYNEKGHMEYGCLPHEEQCKYCKEEHRVDKFIKDNNIIVEDSYEVPVMDPRNYLNNMYHSHPLHNWDNGTYKNRKYIHIFGMTEEDYAYKKILQDRKKYNRKICYEQYIKKLNKLQ